MYDALAEPPPARNGLLACLRPPRQRPAAGSRAARRRGRGQADRAARARRGARRSVPDDGAGAGAAAGGSASRSVPAARRVLRPALRPREAQRARPAGPGSEGEVVLLDTVGELARRVRARDGRVRRRQPGAGGRAQRAQAAAAGGKTRWWSGPAHGELPGDAATAAAGGRARWCRSHRGRAPGTAGHRRAVRWTRRGARGSARALRGRSVAAAEPAAPRSMRTGRIPGRADRAAVAVAGSPAPCTARCRPRATGRCYRRGLLPSARLHGPVISVGNLAVGRRGKTPVAGLDRAVGAGRRPAGRDPPAAACGGPFAGEALIVCGR